MANQPLATHLHQKILELRANGLTVQQIRKQLGVSHGVVVKYMHAASPIPRDKKVGETNWREWVPAMQRMQEVKKKGSFSQDYATVELPHNGKPVALMCLSDLHLGAWSTDYDKLVELTDEILSTPDLYVALLGDYGHYAIKLRNVLEVSDNLIPPEQQTDFLESWFNDIWQKVALATWENHGIERQEKQAGESSTKRLLSRKIVYHNGIGHTDIVVGSQVYRGAFSHTFRGRSIDNATHGIQRYMRREGVDREFGMAGDSHVPGIAKYADGSQIRVAVNSGSLQLGSGYAKRYFSLTTHPVFPILTFDPIEHSLVPYWSIREWLAARGQTPKKGKK